VESEHKFAVPESLLENAVFQNKKFKIYRHKNFVKSECRKGKRGACICIKCLGIHILLGTICV